MHGRTGHYTAQMRAWTRHQAPALLMALAVAGGAAAQAGKAPAAASQPAPDARADKLATGKVLEVDRKAQRVLVAHGPIQSIGMDAMTMEFLVPDRRVLDVVRAGDRIRFAADWKDGEYRITRIERLARTKKGRHAQPGS